MPASDYFALCEPESNSPVEIANSARLDTYMNNGLRPTTFIPGNNCLDDLQVRTLVGEVCQAATPTYSSPEADNAPWYDPLVPESAGFAGVIVTDVEGFEKAPIERPLARRVNGGAAMGQLRYTERVLDFEVQLIGSSCCSVAYGYRWLTSMLQGCCENGCDLPDLKFFESIPNESNRSVCAPGLDGGFLTLPNESNRSPIRTLHQVALAEGPEVTERRGTGCGCGCTPVMTVEFTLIAGTPWLFHDTTEVLPATPLLAAGADCENDPYTWRFCEVPPDCNPVYPAYDPQCASPPAAPTAVPPALNCFCEPLAYRQKQFTFTPVAPDWFEQAMIVTVDNPTAEPLRNVTVRFAQTTSNCDVIGDCDWCSSLGIEYIPAFGRLIIDSARREIVMYVNNQYFNAERTVVSANGSPFRWVDLSCGTYCVRIQTDAFNTPEEATIRIEAATKEL